MYRATVVARQTAGGAGTVGQGAAYVRVYMVRRIGGTTTFLGSETTTTKENDANWDCIFELSGNDVLLSVQGVADQTITWHATIIKQTVGT